MTQQAVKNSAASGTKTNEHNGRAACDGTEKLYGYQDGIVETVRLVLEEAASGKEAITPNVAGALGLKLRAASGWYLPLDSRRTSLSDVARILLAAARENFDVHPVLAGVFASILTGAGTCTDEVRTLRERTEDKSSTAARQSLDLGSAGVRSAGAGTHQGCAEQCSAPQEHKDKPSTAAAANARGREGKEDGIITVSGYYTPEEAEALIENIRDWLSGCREGHRLADLMESIKQKFHLYDSQLGELLGISDRLVGHVRHGRPSPFALARFTEVFGTAGGAVKGDK